jgi:LAS superfamily LD-carboxypeptidase LdcB
MRSSGWSKTTTIVAFILVLALVSLAWLGYIALQQKDKIEMLLEERNYFLLEHASTTANLAVATSTILTLEEALAATRDDLEETQDDLEREERRNGDFENQIEKLAGTVGDLDKLSKTDEELLQKYSKVYFLNEHYQPEKLKEIDNEWKYSEDRSQQLHSQVMPFFEDMVEAARKDSVDLWVVSAFRSFDTQAQLKAAYSVTYGSGANAFSADQGFSEHQLGTTIDFTTKDMSGGLTNAFESTPAFAWLEKNAHKYGFTLSYPKDNAYYVYEPWHWRFVGTDLASDLKKSEAYFYDWDQRKIDAYLLTIFD